MGGRTEVRVGAMWSETGWCQLDSSILYTGLQVWIDETNAGGGMFVPSEDRKLPVRLVHYDDQSDPAVGAEVTRRMIEVDEVDVVCGGGSTEVHQEVVPITEERGVINLNLGAPDSLLFEGCQYQLQVGASVYDYSHSRPAFWAHHGLTRIAVLYPDLPGFVGTHAPLLDFIAEEKDLEVVYLDVPSPKSGRSTAYGPYPEDFDGWDSIIDGLAAARPDAVYIAMHGPAAYELGLAIRRRGIWFKYLEMQYGQYLDRYGLGPEDLLYQFHPGWTPKVDKNEINVGGTPEQLNAAAQRFMPGVESRVIPRAYVGLSVWAHLVAGGGSLDANVVMQQAHKESGSIVTMEGRLEWLDNGDTVTPEAPWTGIYQMVRHPWSGERRSVLVWPEADQSAPPIFTETPYHARPPLWSGAR
jgi:ABC-type branched-subunit amino acid transport system substrate-binding protein